MNRRRPMRDADIVTSSATVEDEVSAAEQDSIRGLYQVKRSHDESRLLTWQEIPEWQQDNEYILRFYRPVSSSFRKCAQTILAVHNETVNIHSHLIGSLLFFSLPAWTFTSVFEEFPNTSQLDVVVFSTFYFGVAICFLLSSTFHVTNNHSQRVAAFGNQLDYLGIVLLMWGATIPTVYYGFHDETKLRNIYWSIVSILGAMCCVATLHPKFRTPVFRPYRSMMYALLGLSAVVFIVHAIIIHGLSGANQRMSLDWMLAMAVLNLTGAVAYGVRFPERLSPGKFDLWGSSHQILHFMVILAGLAHMFGLVRAFRYHHSTLRLFKG